MELILHTFGINIVMFDLSVRKRKSNDFVFELARCLKVIGNFIPAFKGSGMEVGIIGMDLQLMSVLKFS